MNNSEVGEKKLSFSFSSSSCGCCISHEFYKAASKAPNKVAVIHACGGAKLAGELHKLYTNLTNQTDSPADHNFFRQFITSTESLLSSSHPPVYQGDHCFTYSEILAAVDSLSFRLRRILDGGDDPNLIRPAAGSLPNKQSVDDLISDSSKSSTPIVEQSTGYQKMYNPRIVGIYMVPSVEYIIAVLSILRCGEAFMPLDPSWPRERILSIVSSSKVDILIGCQSSVDGSCCHQLDQPDWLVDCCRCPVLLISMKGNHENQSGSSHLTWHCENKNLRSFCYLMYTSGSTGKPKGVCGTEQGLLNRFLWMQELYPLHGEELLLFKTSISFIDHLQEFLGALLTTCTLITPPFHELKENPFCVADYLQVYSINRLVAVPSLVITIMPTLQHPYNMRVQSSLKLLVLSGEVLHLSLWDTLSKLLPKTAILNLYGSTEVSGDCTYFDCKRLPLILEGEALTSVPIGMPISNCDVMLVGEDAPTQGELHVGGLCIATGYFPYPSVMPPDFVKLPQESGCPNGKHGSKYFFKTGDFARQLQSGDLVFLGRKDRSIKVNGQRIALEEIESTLREHPDVVDAAVISSKGKGEVALIEAYLITKQKNACGQILRSSIRSWMVDRLPLVMVPNRFFFTESFPITSTGKVDYKLLPGLTCSKTPLQDDIKENPRSDLLQVIKKAFCDALMVEKVSNDDDFFAMGGNSISAAHTSHSLHIDMRLLYAFPSPQKLQMALLEKEGLCNHDWTIGAHLGEDVKGVGGSMHLCADYETAKLYRNTPGGKLSKTLSTTNADYPVKYLKMDLNLFVNSKNFTLIDGYPWNSSSTYTACSFSRCNKLMHGGEYEGNGLCELTWAWEMPRDKKGSMQELWKVHMESCVDASPLVVYKERDVYLFIGSHSHKFLCINARNGFVLWEIKLEGRIECSAAILGDFSQVIVGCYQGSIYFLDFLDGSIRWTFQTCGEVKSQPVVDNCRHLVWCGSYDHNLYALDYRSYCCIFKFPCGGSIYGSPAIDEVHHKLYVASTSGRVTAISVKDFPFSKLWLRELGVPVFGSLSINSHNGNVICSLVDGRVLALDTSGSIIWRGKTGSPIFAGPCISHTLPYQVLICSRDGSVYSFELEKGDLLWKHYVGDPITSSAYVDENLQLTSELSNLSDRLVCICASSGTIYLLRINLDALGEKNLQRKDVVQEFARLDLQGDIFSSPVMVGGRIFVGCRDDYVHCIAAVGQVSAETLS